MHRFIKGKAVIIAGLLCVGTGLFALLARLLKIQVLQSVYVPYFDIEVSPALILIAAGCILLLIKYTGVKSGAGTSPASDAAEPTDLSALAEKLKNCKDNYQALIEQSFDAIYVLDYNGNFIDSNARLCQLTGYTREELLKLNVTDLIDPVQLKTDPVIPYNSKYDEGIVKERRLVRKNGDMFEVEVSAKKLRENRLLVIAEDVTRRKQLETELHNADLRFHTLAENSSVGVYVVQQETLIFVNQRSAEIFGYAAYELINMPVSFVDVLIGEEYRALVRKNMRAHYEGQLDYVTFEVTGIKRDGSVNHVEFSGSRAVIDGEPTIIGTVIDVTDRWKTEELLKQSEANLQTILDKADYAYALFDKELKTTAFNDAALAFSMNYYGAPLKIGESLAHYFPTDRIPQAVNVMDEVLSGNNVSYEIKFSQDDGSNHWYLTRLFPIMNETKEILGLMLAISNITDRKAAEENLHAAYQRIQKHINSIRDMAWKQSHLIRSPLANLKGLVGLLQDDPSDKDLLKNIGAELDRLDKIIIDMAEDASGHE